MPYTFNPFTGTLDNIGNSVLFSGDYLPLSGGIITGNLGVSGTTTLSGTTIIGDESQIATIFADNGRVGINNETPNEALTIVGNVSATGFYYGDGSNLTGIVAGDTVATTLVRNNSANWDSVYSTVQTNSATNWNYQGTDLKNLSANWESTYSTVSSLSSGWLTTNYLSTNNILLSGLTVTTTISASGTIFSNSNKCVTTIVTDTPGTSAISTILAVSALPLIPDSNILYIVI
jgi:hypothetical protein